MTPRGLLDRLPEAIAERGRPIADRDVAVDGNHVVYWMLHATRGHENPALDAARVTAANFDVPLVV